MALTVAARLVEIESSSGSDSSSSSSTESDDGQLEEGPKSPRYQEEVTVHMTYYKHQKSLITHKLLTGQGQFACKIKALWSWAEL